MTVARSPSGGSACRIRRHGDDLMPSPPVLGRAGPFEASPRYFIGLDVAPKSPDCFHGRGCWRRGRGPGLAAPLSAALFRVRELSVSTRRRK